MKTENVVVAYLALWIKWGSCVTPGEQKEKTTSPLHIHGEVKWKVCMASSCCRKKKGNAVSDYSAWTGEEWKGREIINPPHL